MNWLKRLFSQLFSGPSVPQRELTEEEKLAAKCSEEFRSYDNEWTTYIAHGSYFGFHETTWKWKSDEQSREDQRKRLYSVLESRYLTNREKHSTAGWLLSQMLMEVPPHE